jgi:hypothetical protein
MFSLLLLLSSSSVKMSSAPSTSAKFEVLIAILIEVQVIWNSAPHRLANSYRCFGRVWCLYPQCLLGLLDPESGGSMLLQDVGSLFEVLVTLIYSAVSVRSWCPTFHWTFRHLKMRSARYFKTSNTNNPATWRYIQKGSIQ